MRLRSLLLLAPFVRAASDQSPVHTTTTTLVDLLNSDPDYTQLLHLLQRARLIPTLNKLNGSTLFAPTNEAINRYILWNNFPPSFLDEPLPQEDQPWTAMDNINEQLRQRLLYHLLNHTLHSFPPESIEVHKTLHFPRIPLEPPSKEPPPNPPWLPTPGGSLNGKSQRLRIATRDGSPYVEVDAFGQRGVPVVKDPIVGTNAMLIGIGDVLDVPTDLATIIKSNPSLSYIASLLQPSHYRLLAETPALSLFLPEDPAWDSLHPVEKLYLESEFAESDLKWIIGMHATGGDIAYSDKFGEDTRIKTLEGNELEIKQTSEGTTVSGAELRQKDVYASNGVLHSVSSLLLPPGSLTLTPEKYLLALNCTTFVSLIRSVNLTSLVSDPNAEYTILAPRDDVLKVAGSEGLPESGSDELKKALKYHFIPGKYPINKLKDGLLLETELKEEGLDGGHQVLDVGLSTKDDFAGKGKQTPRDIYFGGAGVIGDPIEINNTLVYLVTRPLTPPGDVLQTALPSLHLSTYLAAVFSTSLASTVKNLPRTTFLIPHNSAWEKMGLVTSYLLMPSSKNDLESVILHHALNEVEYLKDLRNGTERTFRTVEGTDITINRSKDSAGDTQVSINPSGGWDGLLADLKIETDGSRERLTETGVLHEVVNGLLLPRSVEITVGKLVRAAGGGTMASLIARAGMDWVLNGTAPPEDSPWASDDIGGWTLLVPRDEAWKQVNLTRLWNDDQAIKELVTQHLVPTQSSNERLKKEKDKTPTPAPPPSRDSSMPLDMDGGAYDTARSKESSYGDLVFMEREPGRYVVGIKGARGTAAEEDWAKVLAWGRSTSTFGSSGGERRGGVIKIDRVLTPYTPKWWVRYGPHAAGAAGTLILLTGAGFGIRYYIKRKETEATYEPIGRHEEEDA